MRKGTVLILERGEEISKEEYTTFDLVISVDKNDKAIVLASRYFDKYAFQKEPYINLSSTEEKKQYPIPEELSEKFVLSEEYEQLRDICIKIPFGSRLAMKFAKKNAEIRNKMWREVYVLYPELIGKRIQHASGYISIMD